MTPMGQQEVERTSDGLHEHQAHASERRRHDWVEESRSEREPITARLTEVGV